MATRLPWRCNSLHFCVLVLGQHCGQFFKGGPMPQLLGHPPGDVLAVPVSIALPRPWAVQPATALCSQAGSRRPGQRRPPLAILHQVDHGLAFGAASWAKRPRAPGVQVEHLQQARAAGRAAWRHRWLARTPRPLSAFKVSTWQHQPRSWAPWRIAARQHVWPNHLRRPPPGPTPIRDFPGRRRPAMATTPPRPGQGAGLSKMTVQSGAPPPWPAGRAPGCRYERTGTWCGHHRGIASPSAWGRRSPTPSPLAG